MHMKKKYTDQHIVKIAKTYTKRSAFKKDYPSLYAIATRRGIWGTASEHMEYMVKPVTFQQIKDIARQCHSKTEFKQSYPDLYRRAWERGILNDICAGMNPIARDIANCDIVKAARAYCDYSSFRHQNRSLYNLAKGRKILSQIRMILPQRDTISARKKEVKRIARKYFTRNSFVVHEHATYEWARIHGVLEEACAHMKRQHKSWDQETIKSEALKYLSRIDFRNNNSRAYAAARRYKILDKVCAHMKKPKRGYGFHFIYIYRFPKAIYIGLSCRERRRFTEHQKEGSVWEYANAHNLPIPKPEIYQKYIADPNQAVAIERKLIAQYRNKSLNTLEVLNKAKGGSVGSYAKGKWTVAAMREEALKYQTRRDFELNSSGAYSKAVEYKMLDELCAHMRPKHVALTNEALADLAQSYTTRKAFCQQHPNERATAKRRGIWKEISAHMQQLKRPAFTIEELREEAKKYTTRGAFGKGSRTAYNRALNLGVLEEICLHMQTPQCKKKG